MRRAFLLAAAACLAVPGGRLVRAANPQAALPAGGTEPAYGFEEGLASWYGAEFQGKPTASGERFDKDALTAAHRTLPFGTMLLVTNEDDGRSARVRVNDRGPFVKGRILDCSEGAARALGFAGSGTARVKLEVLGSLPAPDDPHLSKKDRKRLKKALAQASHDRRDVQVPTDLLRPVDPSAGPFAVQVGAFANGDNARRLVAAMAERGLPAFEVVLPDNLHHVRVGPYRDRPSADASAKDLESEGHETFVTRDDRPQHE